MTDAITEPSPAEPPEAADSRKAGGDAALFLILFVLALLLRTLIAAPFSIPSGSRSRASLSVTIFSSPIVLRLFAYSLPFGLLGFDGRILGGRRARRRRRFPHPAGGNDLVKRVIGLPGDTIELRRAR